MYCNNFTLIMAKSLRFIGKLWYNKSQNEVRVPIYTPATQGMGLAFARFHSLSVNDLSIGKEFAYGK